MDKMTKQTDVRRYLHTPSGLHVREAGEGSAPSRTITGYALLFGVPSAPLYSDDEEEAREVIAPGAVTRELLDGCDIKMTMFHDRQLILARSRGGEGTLSYGVDAKGVYFEFEAPATADGDKALELVRRGDLSGCSFAFSTHYFDRAYVSRDVERRDGKTLITYTVRIITAVYDFTLAADPAYPDTHCEAEARELASTLRSAQLPPAADSAALARIGKQVDDMRRAASRTIKTY